MGETCRKKKSWEILALFVVHFDQLINLPVVQQQCSSLKRVHLPNVSRIVIHMFILEYLLIIYLHPSVYVPPPLEHWSHPPRIGLPLEMPPITQLTIPEIFEALNNYTARKIHRIFRPIFIYDVQMCDAFVYTLTTSYERRYTKWSFKPHKPDDPTDEPTQAHKIVDPWLVPVGPVDYFKTHSKIMRVPRSDFIMLCSRCDGQGLVICPWCSGSGKDPFGKCTLCTGSGITKCKICEGYRKIKLYLVTKVKWSTKRTSIIVDTSDSGIKDEKFFKRTSTVILNEDCKAVPYIADIFDYTNAYQEKLAHAINHVILNHESNCGQFKRIVAQRQTISHIPVAVVSYEFKKEHHLFHVIGKEKKVVFKQSPSTFCTII